MQCYIGTALSCKGDTPFYGAMALHSPATCCLADPGFADAATVLGSCAVSGGGLCTYIDISLCTNAEVTCNITHKHERER